MTNNIAATNNPSKNLLEFLIENILRLLLQNKMNSAIFMLTFFSQK